VTLLDRVAALLDAQRVPHALIGAAALAAAGVARSTFDVDLLTGDARVLADDFWSALRTAEVSVDIRRGDDEDPLAGIVRLDTAADRPVDIIVAKHAWQARMIERAQRVPGGPPVVTPPDLILLKLYAGGHQDLWDVRELLSTAGGDAIARQVDDSISGMPSEMRDRWLSVR